MTYAPLDIFSFAHWLYETKPTVPSSSLIRTIINRSYYAALISARDFTGSQTSGKNGHKQVVDALKEIDPIAANDLNVLRLCRHKADYNLNCKLTSRDAQLSLVNSRKVLYVSGSRLPHGIPYSYDFLDKSKFINPEEKAPLGT